MCWKPVEAWIPATSIEPISRRRQTLKLGFVSEEDFNRAVDRAKMVRR
jgi:hypothetical protein